jgi:hypothetical protein
MWETPTVFSAPIVNARDMARAVANTRLIGFTLDANRRVTPLPLPPGVATIFAPVAAVSADGTVHVLWAAPSDTSKDTPSVVWYASYKNGQWRPPDRLFSATELDWRATVRPQLINEHGRLHVLFSSWTNGKGSSVDYLRYSNGGWTHARLPIIGLASATMAITSPDSIVVAYGATDINSRERNGSHLYITRAAQRDTLWSRGTLVQWRGLGGVQFSALVDDRGSPNRLTLLWGGTNPATRKLDSLFVSVSADGGVGWDRPAAFAIGGSASSVTVAQTSGQTIHVIYGLKQPAGTSGGTRIGYAVWRRSRWHPQPSLPINGVESEPMLAAFGNDSLLLTWGVGRHASPEDVREAPVSAFAVARSPVCEAESSRRP